MRCGVPGQFMLLHAVPFSAVLATMVVLLQQSRVACGGRIDQVEQFSGGCWRRDSAFTLDSEDEGHPLPAASQASSRWFTCCAGPSGVIPGVNAATECGAPSGSWWRKMKDLITFWN
jgi:hypothetical protein